MASTPVVCGGLVALGLFLLQVIGVGTDYWLTIHTNLTGTSDFRAGLFEVCVDGSVKGNSSIECIPIPAGLKLSIIQRLCAAACVALFFNVIISVVGIVRSRHGRLIVKYLSGIWLIAVYLNTIQGLCIMACVALFFNVIISVVGFVRFRPGRLTVENLSGVWLVAAVCSITSVLLFYNTQFNDVNKVSSPTSLQRGIKLGYSFYLAAVAGGGTLIAAITMFVIARQMDVPLQTVATSAAP